MENDIQARPEGSNTFLREEEERGNRKMSKGILNRLREKRKYELPKKEAQGALQSFVRGERKERDATGLMSVSQGAEGRAGSQRGGRHRAYSQRREKRKGQNRTPFFTERKARQGKGSTSSSQKRTRTVSSRRGKEEAAEKGGGGQPSTFHAKPKEGKRPPHCLRPQRKEKTKVESADHRLGS